MSTFKSLHTGGKMMFFPFTISRREVLLSYLITYLSVRMSRSPPIWDRVKATNGDRPQRGLHCLFLSLGGCHCFLGGAVQPPVHLMSSLFSFFLLGHVIPQQMLLS